MPLAYIVPKSGNLETFFAEIIEITPASPPDRPRPQPPGPGKPTHPIALPGDPWWGGDLKPTHPIVIPPDMPPPNVPPPVGGQLPQAPEGWVYAYVVSPSPGGWAWVAVAPPPAKT